VYRALSGHSSAKNAEAISFEGTAFSEFRLLAQLTKLKELDLTNTRIENLEPVQGLTDLQTLFLFDTAITNLKPLSQLVQLQNLGLGGAQLPILSHWRS